jgi:hypothetical protein
MNDDLHYSIAPIDLGTFLSVNHPRSIKSRRLGWIVFAWFSLAMGAQAVGWVVLS